MRSDVAAVSFGTVARNALWNLAGRVVPLAVALVAIPLQIEGFGADRFGLLALFWVVAAYFGLFDMGIGRATTKFVAERLALKDFGAIPALVWTSWLALAALGMVAGVVLALSTALFVSRLLNVPQELQGEATRSMYWLAAMLPLLLTQPGLQGVLEVRQRFDLGNLIQIPAAILGYMVPLAVLIYTNDLGVVMAALWVTRCLTWGALFVCALRVMPAIACRPTISGEHLGRVLRFGGWLTVSNIASPLMVYADRFLIGSLLTVSAVAYYATPYSFVTQLWIIPSSLLPVLFPVFSGMAAISSPAFGEAYRRTVRCIFFSMMPLSVGLMVLSRDLMTLWIGADFARHSASVLSLLALGVLVNSLAQVPYAVLQASGRPDVTAKFHLLELAPYFFLLFWFTERYGILGTAAAWVARVSVDAALLFVVTGRLTRVAAHRPAFLAVFVVATGLFYVAMEAAVAAMPGPLSRWGAAALVALLAAVAAWRYWLTADEKAALYGLNARLARAKPRGAND